MNIMSSSNNNNRLQPQSFHNSAYNNGNNLNSNSNTNYGNVSRVHFEISDKKELDELNNRLNVYVNTVRQLAEHRIYGYHNDTTFNLINSMKYLENDIDVLKELHENEMKILRLQIDELNNEKSKYRLESYNLDSKLRELTQKFQDEKVANEKCFKDRHDLKSLNEKLEYDLKNLRIEFERPVVEYNQLKREFDALNNSFNQLQAKYDTESRARQELENKFNELTNEHVFYKKHAEERIDTLETESRVARNTVKDLDTKLKDNQDVDSNITILLNDVRDKAECELQRYKAEAEQMYQKNLNYINEQLKETRLSYEKLKLENMKFEQRNDTLQTICRNLEATVQNLEHTKKSLENELNEHKTQALKNLNDIEDRLNDFQQLFLQSLDTKQPPVSINLEIESLKELINDEEYRLKHQHQQQQQQQNLNNNRSYDSSTNNEFRLNYLTTTNENIEEQSQRKSVDSGVLTKYKLQQQQQQVSAVATPAPAPPPPLAGPIGPISLTGRRIHSAKSSNRSLPLQENNYFLNENNNNIDELVDKQQQQSQPLSSQASNRLRASSATLHSKRVSPSYTPSLQQQQQQQQSYMQPSQSTVVKDYTSEMFSSFQKTALKHHKTQQQQSSFYNSVDNTVTEASYTGNIKIHEVNKNGYYIRLLNVSNNCDEDISSYTIQQMVSSMPVAVYRLPNNLQLPAGQTVTIWSRTDEVEQNPPHTFVCKEQEKWGTGVECTTILAKPNGQAVSWVSGCHKFGNMDNDEIASVYSRSQKRTRSAVQLNREKITPHVIYNKYNNQTKHATTSALLNSNANNNPLESLHRQRSMNSASSARKPIINTTIDDLNISIKSMNSSFNANNNKEQQHCDNFSVDSNNGELDDTTNDYTYQQNIAYYRITRN